LSVNVKKEVLKLLKEDEEFRYAVAGFLGLETILNELRSLREDFNKYVMLEERRWEENSRRWEENSKRWEESNRRWEENWRRWEESSRRWEENSKRWEENNRRWEEAYKRFEAIENELKSLREDFNRTFESFSRRLDALGARWGVIAEESFREGMRAVVQRILGVARVDKWVYYDAEGEVYGKPSIVEVDIIIKDDTHILVEVKPSISRGDVAEFLRISKLYERVCRVKPKLVIISPYIDLRAYELAKELGIEVYTQT